MHLSSCDGDIRTFDGENGTKKRKKVTVIPEHQQELGHAEGAEAVNPEKKKELRPSILEARALCHSLCQSLMPEPYARALCQSLMSEPYARAL